LGNSFSGVSFLFFSSPPSPLALCALFSLFPSRHRARPAPLSPPGSLFSSLIDLVHPFFQDRRSPFSRQAIFSVCNLPLFRRRVQLFSGESAPSPPPPSLVRRPQFVFTMGPRLFSSPFSFFSHTSPCVPFFFQEWFVFTSLPGRHLRRGENPLLPPF